MRASLTGLFALLVVSTASAQKEFGFDNRKGSGQPYLSPQETVNRMTVPPEFEVKLFAGEPQLANPIAFTIDERGRVWAIECFEYPSRTPAGKMPRDRIVILEDTDGDGACDKRTVFAEGKDFPERFDLASGIEVGRGGVYVGAPPYLWFIENKNDKPGKFEILLKGFGSQDTHETLNTFQWGPDGQLYGLHGVFTQSQVKPLDGPETRMNAAVWRFHPVTKKFEIFAEGTSNPWGMDWRNTDGQFILACCVIPHLFHIVPGGIYKRQAGGSYNPYAYSFINEICDHTFHKESGWAHAGLISLDVPHMPEKYRNSVVFGSIHGCSLKQNILKPNGSSYTASRGDDFLTSGDKNVRPINLKWGPNGDIYLIDWHDQNPCHQAKPTDWDYERGRVYRIQLKGAKTKKAENLGALSREQLARVVTEKDPYRYRTALRLLHEQPAGEFKANDDELGPVKSLWVANAAKLVGEESAKKFTFPAEGVTDDLAGSIRWIAESGFVTADTVQTLADVVSKAKGPAVRRELASAAVRLADTHDVRPLLRALMANKDDAFDPLIPHLTWLAYEKSLINGGAKPKQGEQKNTAAAIDEELKWLAESATGNIFIRDQIVPKVMRRLVATGKGEDVARCVRFLGQATDVNVKEKALDGLLVAFGTNQTAPPPEWKEIRTGLLALRNDRITALTDKLSVSFRDVQAYKAALNRMGNEKLSEAQRLEAIRQTAQYQNPESLKALFDVAKTAKSDVLKLEAVRATGGINNYDVPMGLINNWVGFTPTIKAEAVNILAGRKEWAATLLTSMKEGVIERAFVTDNTITKIQAFNDKRLNTLIEDTWGRTRPTPDELNKVIDKTRADLQTNGGSFARGVKVFENQCAKCHKFDGKGNEVGPQLDGAGRDIEYLLANILDPNRVIGAPYFVRQANTVDGVVYQGVLAEEDDQHITLKIENAQLKKIPKKDLDGPVKVLEKSMMPEGLGYNMTAQDFRDLVRYVMANPFVTQVTVNGKAMVAPVTGKISLQSAKTDEKVVIETRLTVTDDFKTKLLVGSGDAFEVVLDGKKAGSGKGVGRGNVAPDRESVELSLSKGEHVLQVKLKYSGGTDGLYVRLADPDRKVRYADQ